MKSDKSLRKSADARLNQAFSKSARIYALISAVQRGEWEMTGRRIAQLRRDTESLLQCVHEFNAYTNALETD